MKQKISKHNLYELFPCFKIYNMDESSINMLIIYLLYFIYYQITPGVGLQSTWDSFDSTAIQIWIWTYRNSSALTSRPVFLNVLMLATHKTE